MAEKIDSERFGKATRWEAVRADSSDNRDRLADAPVCSLLEFH